MNFLEREQIAELEKSRKEWRDWALFWFFLTVFCFVAWIFEAYRNHP